MEKVEANYLILIKDQDVMKDLSSLVSLYEPIIGSDALALYLTLINEAFNLKQLNYPKFELTRLYTISSLTKAKFTEAIKKLESLRLVKSKVSRQTGSLKYEIFAPLEASEFFANVLFEKTLTAKIGLENLEALKFLYKEKQDHEGEDDFEDVTAMFEDVFAEELEKIQTSPCVDDAEFTNLVSSKKTILEKMLDLNLLTSILKTQKITLNYNSQKVKKTLNWALSVYNFNEETLAQLIINNFDFTKNRLDLKFLESEVKGLINLKKQQLIQEQITQAVTLPSVFNTSEELSEQEIQQAQELNLQDPQVFVKKLTEQNLDWNTKKLIKDLTEGYSLQAGSINCLMEFSHFKNQKIVPNYLYKIANSLKGMGIRLTTDTMIYLNQFKTPMVKSFKTYEKKHNFDFNSTFNTLSYDEIVQLTTEI